MTVQNYRGPRKQLYFKTKQNSAIKLLTATFIGLTLIAVMANPRPMSDDRIETLPNQIIWNRDGAEMAFVPAGSFDMGDHLNEGYARELPVHTVTLDAFYMDRHEVTAGQFKQFVRKSGYSYTHHTWEQVAQYSPTDDYPMIYVNWYDAAAYAEWAGKRLPTEAEWEYAARGGLISKRYPWGNKITSDKANYSGPGSGDKWDKTAPVGSVDANGYGLYDMAGNAWEWCADWYDENYYSRSPATNPLGPDTGSQRVVRGGSWLQYFHSLRLSSRSRNDPSVTFFTYGFRCASGSVTHDTFSLFLPASGQTGANWFTDLTLNPTDYRWAKVNPASSGLRVRLFVQPLGGVNTSSWDFRSITTAGGLSTQ